MAHSSTQTASKGDYLPAVDSLRIASTEITQDLPPITNFPLPAELRQEIYGYLLDGGRVKVTTVKSDAEDTSGGDADSYATYQWIEQKFAFSTGIFGVNKAISAEATSYFYTENVFVLVHFDMPGFHLMANMMDLPIVVEGDLGDQRTYKRITLMISLTWHFAPYRQALQDLGHDDKDHGSVIIRMSDVPTVFKMLRFLCAHTFPPSLLVASGRNEALRLLPTADLGQLQMKVVNQPQMFKPLSRSEQALLLAQLERLLGGGYDLAIAGFTCPEPIVRRLEPMMTQTLIWPAAFQTDHLEVSRELMRSIDRVASTENLSAAAARYKALSYFEKSSTRHIWYHVGEIPGVRDLVYPRIEYFKSDFCCAVATIQLRRGRSLEARRIFEYCVKSNVPITAQALSWVGHLMTLSWVVEGSLAPGQLQLMVDRLKNLPVRDAWIAHDLDLLQREMVGWTQESNDVQVLVHRLSIHTMPLRTYDSYEDVDVRFPLPHRGDLVGWRDATHFANLSEEDKSTIKQMQEKNHLSVTSFD